MGKRRWISALTAVLCVCGCWAAAMAAPPAGDRWVPLLQFSGEFQGDGFDRSKTEKRKPTEIDVFEVAGVAPWNHRYTMTAFAPDRVSSKNRRKFSQRWEAPFSFADEYHVYGLEWGPNSIKWYVDDKVVFRLDSDHWHQRYG